MISGLEIPVVKLTVDYMKTAILHALDPKQLSQQLDAACKKALAEIDFERMIRDTIYRLAEEVVQDDSVTGPIRDYLDVEIKEALKKIIPQTEMEE